MNWTLYPVPWMTNAAKAAVARDLTSPDETLIDRFIRWGSEIKDNGITSFVLSRAAKKTIEEDLIENADAVAAAINSVFRKENIGFGAGRYNDYQGKATIGMWLLGELNEPSNLNRLAEEFRKCIEATSINYNEIAGAMFIASSDRFWLKEDKATGGQTILNGFEEFGNKVIAAKEKLGALAEKYTKKEAAVVAATGALVIAPDLAASGSTRIVELAKHLPPRQ